MVPGEPLRDRLVRAGVALLEEEGASGVTLRAIARRAGVSHGAPRRYFPTRSALLSAVAAGGFQALHQAMAGGVGEGDLRANLSNEGDPHPQRRPAEAFPAQAAQAADPVARLRRASLADVDFAIGNRGMFELMFRHDLLVQERPSLRHSGLPTFATFVSLVRSAQQTGWRADVPPRVLAGSLWSSLHGLAQLWLWGALPLATNRPDLDAVLQATLDAYLPARRTTEGRP